MGDEWLIDVIKYVLVNVYIYNISRHGRVNKRSLLIYYSTILISSETSHV